MFPFVQISKRPWFGPGLLMASLVLLNLTPQFLDRAPTTPVPQTDVCYLNDMEAHLKAKAGEVIERFTSEDYTVDLCLELDTTAVTTTTYIPGDKILVADQEKSESLDRDQSDEGNGYRNCTRSQKWELTGTWTESTDVRPRIKQIRCCITLPQGENIDHDHLFQCLSAALGVNLERGDILKLVEH